MVEIPLISNLKPCAHCGSNNIEKFTLPATQSPTGTEAHTCNCVECGMSTGGFATLEEATAAWNQRVGTN